MKKSNACERTQKNISKCFLDLLLKKDFKDINVADICERALITRATFYNYYEDKKHLFSCIINEYKEKLLLKNLNVKDYKTPKELCMKIAEVCIDFFFAKKELLAKLLKHCKGEEVEKLFTNEMEFNLLDLLKNMPYSENYRIPLPILAKFYTGGLIYAVTYLITENTKYTPQNILDYIDIIINDEIFEKK